MMEDILGKTSSLGLEIILVVPIVQVQSLVRLFLPYFEISLLSLIVLFVYLSLYLPQTVKCKQVLPDSSLLL